eukprot:TRINITY_DN2143_c1_g2_i1.p1 TRINITY_DN2143_c1_g2~~TRINITY_DN2143_c1_g2_i1.p1  ORF type:complete len:102 (+),score=4.53 TRINITY_DN2143_c1_g2_i1:161-466(+)
MNVHSRLVAKHPTTLLRNLTAGMRWPFQLACTHDCRCTYPVFDCRVDFASMLDAGCTRFVFWLRLQVYETTDFSPPCCDNQEQSDFIITSGSESCAASLYL